HDFVWAGEILAADRARHGGKTGTSRRSLGLGAVAFPPHPETDAEREHDDHRNDVTHGPSPQSSSTPRAGGSLPRVRMLSKPFCGTIPVEFTGGAAMMSTIAEKTSTTWHSDASIAYAILRLTLGVNIGLRGIVRIAHGPAAFAQGIVKQMEMTILPPSLV